jgi:hypothetical protein
MAMNCGKMNRWVGKCREPTAWAPVCRSTEHIKEAEMADRETIIETGGGGSGAAVIGGVALVALVLAMFFLFFNQNGGSRTVDVDVPAVTVDVTPDGQ